MAKQDALNFIQQVEKDANLEAQVGRLEPDDAAGLIQVARDAGNSMCVADFKAAAEELGRSAGDLSEEELETVAAGYGGSISMDKVRIYYVNFSRVFTNVRFGSR